MINSSINHTPAKIIAKNKYATIANLIILGQNK